MEQSYVKTDFENENLEVRFIQQLKIRIGLYTYFFVNWQSHYKL